MEKIKIAIIDSGISEKYTTNSVILQKDFIHLRDEEEKAIDLNGHGTYCYTIINSQCMNCEYIIFKVLDKNRYGSSSSLQKALFALLDMNVNIVNLSLSIINDIQNLQIETICKELVEKGSIIVASLANGRRRSLPAIWPFVIGVQSSYALSGEEFWYSSQKEIQCVANGIPILVKDLNDNYTFWGGNSKAAASFTGILAKSMLGYNNTGKKDIETLFTLKGIRSEWIQSDIITDLEKIYGEIIIPNDFDINLLERVCNIVSEILKLDSEKRGLLKSNSLFNPLFGLSPNKAGQIIETINNEFNYAIPMLSEISIFASIYTLYTELYKNINNMEAQEKKDGSI